MGVHTINPVVLVLLVLSTTIEGAIEIKHADEGGQGDFGSRVSHQ